uniref:J domain-containing protein n=1 Tax=Alexandrium monilatum TaxID=311494 RepID=A0A7S4VW06_9DINO
MLRGPAPLSTAVPSITVPSLLQAATSPSRGCVGPAPEPLFLAAARAAGACAAGAACGAAAALVLGSAPRRRGSGRGGVGNSGPRWVAALGAFPQDGPGTSVTSVPTDYYSLLGLPRIGAKRDDIRRAYRRVVKLVHPDILGGNTKELTGIVRVAYETLSDESKRASYDEELREQRPGVGGGPQQGSWGWNPRGFDAGQDFVGDAPSVKEEEEKEVANEDARGKRRSVWSKDAPSDARGIFVDESQCVICHHCVECAPETFEIDVDGTERARVVRQYGDPAEEVEWARKSCPTNAISYVSREDLVVLEDLMEECNLEQPDTMMRRRICGSSGFSRPPLGPFELLERFKRGEPMSTKFRELHGHFGSMPGAKRLGGKRHDANAVEASIEKAVQAVPEEVRVRLWPGSSPPV